MYKPACYHSTHDDYQKYMGDLIVKWGKRQSRRIDEDWLLAALILIRLDLDSLRDELSRFYAPDKHVGCKAYDPVCMLRAMLLMVILGYRGPKELAKKLKAHYRLALICGFDPNETPCCGSFYTFVNRLVDGPYQKPCKHTIRPSELRKARYYREEDPLSKRDRSKGQMFKRNLKEEKQQAEEEKKGIKNEHGSLTEQQHLQLNEQQEDPRPNDFLKILEDIFAEMALSQSIVKGLFDSESGIVVFGDGSKIDSDANRHGTALCNCRSQGIFNCDHKDKLYSDPDANWGWDSHRRRYIFGYNFYQHCAFLERHNLPLHVEIHPASTNDMVINMPAFDRMLKMFREHNITIKVQVVCYDAGHDAYAIHEYHVENGRQTVIPIKTISKKAIQTEASPTLVTPDGTPICPGGKPMKYFGPNKKKHWITYHCPAKWSKREGPKKTIHQYCPERCPRGVQCRPDQIMGPLVYVRPKNDLRLYPEIPRKSPRYKEIMKQRTSCERSNSFKKAAGRLESVCRSKEQYLFRLYLSSIIEHARVWLAEDQKLVGGKNYEKLVDPGVIKAPIPKREEAKTG